MSNPQQERRDAILEATRIMLSATSLLAKFGVNYADLEARRDANGGELSDQDIDEILAESRESVEKLFPPESPEE